MRQEKLFSMDDPFSKILHDHFEKIAHLYRQITPGENLSSETDRTASETELISEISSTRNNLRRSILSLDRPRPIEVRTGDPKGSWAHSYYVSFHDPQNSSGPTRGFYPAFLMSVDQKFCWLTVMIAAGSVGISGRGGWSQLKGNRLIDRADLMGRTLIAKNGWTKGAITLGADGSSLHQERGTNRSSARGYECGSIIAKQFNPKNPPNDLEDWLIDAFEYYDLIFSEESDYIANSVPSVTDREWYEQENAIITGQKAEGVFLNWAKDYHPEWGEPEDKTDRVGLGFDIGFPDVGLKVEVKGSKKGIDSIRMTSREWETSKKDGEAYILAIVSNLDTQGEETVKLFRNPFMKFSGDASSHKTTQVTYTIPGLVLRKRPEESS